MQCLVCAIIFFLLVLSVKKEMQASETSLGEVVQQNMVSEFSDSVSRKFVPILVFANREFGQENHPIEQQLAELMPIYGYSRKMQGQDLGRQEHPGEYLFMEDVEVKEVEAEGEVIQQSEDEDALEDLLMAENEMAIRQSLFIPHELQQTIDLQALANYENLVNMFYTIDANTMAGSEQLDVAKLLGKDLTLSKEGEGPQILIYHTHSQEGFADSIPGDTNTSIVGVGAYLSKILENKYGYRVLHHTGQYDVKIRDDAYANSLPAIEQVLAEHPTIEVIIDLHRDSMPEGTKLVMDLDGRPTARFMFFNGLSRTKNTGDIAYLYNENQEDNLAFSFQMQLKAMEYYPGLTRKIYLKGYRYNMHLRPRTTLIELGAQNNTVEEAMNACDPLAHIIDMVLSKQ